MRKKNNTWFLFFPGSDGDITWQRLKFNGAVPEELKDLKLKGQKGNILVYARDT